MPLQALHSSSQPTTNDTIDEVENSSEISSTKDSKLKAELDEFDEQLTDSHKTQKNKNPTIFNHLIVLLIDHFNVDNVVHVKCTSGKIVFLVLVLFLSQFLYICNFCMFTLYICTFFHM